MAIAAIVGVYVSWRAGRVDRLHARVEAARGALDAALVRRSSVALELASSGLLDPATSLLLAQAGHDARAAARLGSARLGSARLGSARLGSARLDSGQHGHGQHGHGQADQELPRELAESDLSRALRAAFAQPDFRTSLNGQGGAAELLAELEAAAHQVFLARRFYNDAVAVTLSARRRRLVRLLRLAGNAALPEFFEIDDSLVASGGEGDGADMPRLTG